MIRCIVDLLDQNNLFCPLTQENDLWQHLCQDFSFIQSELTKIIFSHLPCDTQLNDLSKKRNDKKITLEDYINLSLQCSKNETTFQFQTLLKNSINIDNISKEYS
ncbi:hypothetical protein [Candidatus Curculioniphilus buchneri]|uniref:hypothetical protein n=1 Tax=Candidatus Curculioniphilus buchneri TaxID=690594 RepID=UPI00376ED842